MSRYGIVSVIGAESGKVIDVEVKSSYCKICQQRKGPKKGTEYEMWLQQHKPQYTVNHIGSAGSMECEGMKEIFKRSMNTRKLRYIEYIGDSDAKTFKSVHDLMPYGPDN